MAAKFDLYETVTQRIINALEHGTKPWRRPWNMKEGEAVYPYNAATKRRYSGINVMLLWSTGYTSNGWMTFKQAKALGGSVRKGEKASIIVYWNKVESRTETDSEGNPKTYFLLRYYNVFNVEQIDGLPESYAPLDDAEHDDLLESEKLEGVDSLVEALRQNAGLKLTHGGNSAHYSPVSDSVAVPERKQFHDAESYAATLLHELVHWSGGKPRLGREWLQSFEKFGDENYAKEELVAEIGSAFLCANFGIDPEKTQHESYVAAWLKVLKNDKRLILKAARLAQEAADYLLAFRKAV